MIKTCKKKQKSGLFKPAHATLAVLSRESAGFTDAIACPQIHTMVCDPAAKWDGAAK
jgi:hypothetical protein